jgi:hypothetical protein
MLISEKGLGKDAAISYCGLIKGTGFGIYLEKLTKIKDNKINQIKER